MHDESSYLVTGGGGLPDADNGDHNCVVGRGVEWSRWSVWYVMEIWIRSATAAETDYRMSTG